MRLGQPTELVPWVLGGLTELIPLDSGSAHRKEVIPIRLGQPTELVAVDVGWADGINSPEQWVSPLPGINSNPIGSAH
jgi:hypothetical protein